MYIPTGIAAVRGGTGAGKPRTLPEGTKRRVDRGAGLKEDLVRRGGAWVSVGLIKTRQRLECEKAGVPEQYLAECVEARTARPGKPARAMIDITHLLICADLGVPPEQREECRKLLRGGMSPADIAAAIAEGQQPADIEGPRAARGSRLPIYLGVAGAAAVGLFFFLKRRKR